MSFTDFYYDKKEKQILDYEKYLINEELQSGKVFQNLFDALQELRCNLETNLIDDK